MGEPDRERMSRRILSSIAGAVHDSRALPDVAFMRTRSLLTPSVLAIEREAPRDSMFGRPEHRAFAHGIDLELEALVREVDARFERDRRSDRH